MTVDSFAEIADLGALTPAGEYLPRRRETISDITGAPITNLAQVPSLWIGRAIDNLRARPHLPQAERLTRLAVAAEAFQDGVYAGLNRSEYETAVARLSGVPQSVVHEAAEAIIECARNPQSAFMAQPTGTVPDWHDPATHRGHGVWTRRGDLLAVHAAGNHPGPHSLWLEAVALGFRVAVRPSRREPLTAYRLVRALQDADLDDYVAYIPTDHQGASEVLRACDLGLVYGGDEVTEEFGNNPDVLTQGPGRAKILILSDSDWRAHLDTIVGSISHQGGVACINATAVLVEGDPGPVAKAIAERLSDLPLLPPEDSAAVLPAAESATAKRLSDYLVDTAQGADLHLGAGGVAKQLQTGGALLTPSVCELKSASDPRVGTELPFPCVWVAPWNRTDPTSTLGPSLVVTVIGDDDSLVDRLIDDPQISNIYIGDVPTYWLRPGVPHDSFLGEFLMRTKTVRIIN